MHAKEGRYRKKCLPRFISKPAVIEVFHVHARERRLGPHHHVGTPGRMVTRAIY